MGIVPSISSSPIPIPPSSFSIQCCLANNCNNQSVAPWLSPTVAPSASTTLTIELILSLHQNTCFCVAPWLSPTAVAPSATTTLTIKLILTLHQNTCLCILNPECVFVKVVGLESKRLHRPFLVLSMGGKTKSSLS